MKTLDEVIKALDGWMLDCDNCPLYCRRDENCTISDALHYLKEYRDDRENFSEAISNCGKALNKYIMDIHALAQQEENLPLTWDELKQMEGRPVWLEDQFQNDVKTWCIVERIVKDEDCEYIILDGLYFPKDYLGEKINGWQAYRKER